MTYMAISRKYRPATFEEIVGQEHVTTTLRNAIRGSRIHHAYLFTGARGVGKTTAARALARSLNCALGPTETPCGTCPSCTQISAGATQDLIEIDGASNNSVDDVREIRDSVQFAPNFGQYKIYLVDEVHMLSKGAFNALLKTLEEPPPHVVFIFATTEPNKIPDTILSRVQRFDFKRIPASRVVERLASLAAKEGIQIPEQGLRLIARAGEGSMRDSESLLDQVISAGAGAAEIPVDTITQALGLVDRRLLLDFFSGLVDGDPAACLTVIDSVYRWGHELSVFADELLEVVRDATFLGMSQDAHRFVDLPQAELEALAAIAKKTDPEHLSRLFDALIHLQGRLKAAHRPRIVMEMAVARLTHTRPAKPLSGLVQRLERIERNLSSGTTSARRASTPPSSGQSRAPRARKAKAPASPPPEKEPSRPPSRPEPPPIEQELEAWGPALSDIQPAIEERTVLSKWDAFVQALPNESWKKSFEGCIHVDDGKKVRVKLSSGRARAAITRWSKTEEFHYVWQKYFPNRTLELDTERASGNLRGMEQAFLNDPEVGRIMSALGAVLERVEPDSGAESNESV